MANARARRGRNDRMLSSNVESERPFRFMRSNPSRVECSQHDSTAQPAVSVLMPCYNAEDTVDKAVQSILQQSLERLELILVDDGSRDGTAAKLAEWASSDRRVRVIARSHEGILGALNAGLSHCQAPYVARMDADDIAHPERLARQVETLDAHPDLAVVGSLVEGFPQEDVREGFRIYLDWLNRLVTHDAIVREIFIESPLAHPSVCMRRRWLERVGGYQDHGWPEDYDLWLRLYLA
ncbi:MAG TPA: glycosyltransferase family 2 protein, partial [Chloroflexi bacterium]|nr:glycosyltransferase family 2 protein [Chloroflexota bacterium]